MPFVEGNFVEQSHWTKQEPLDGIEQNMKKIYLEIVGLSMLKVFCIKMMKITKI